ncbi:MAG: sigma-70 family RNA polymerase sigma factor [Tepidisphaeraceae bacterium]|jgi:RNA polymerase sigma factor (sigma-70 family)
MNNALKEYIQTGSADAFRQIVETQIDSVYSQCLRKLHNVAQAEDVAQVVFATLAQKAARLPAGVVLEGWLFTTTRFCCANAQRAAGRRSAAEQRAAIMRNEAVATAASEKAASLETEELLDDAIAHLGERDRNAVLLRFFGGRSLREVGQVMGVSEDAARQRVFRAIERLRDYFRSKGITADSATISASLGMAVKPAGAELAHAAIRLAAAKAAAASKISSAGIFSRLSWTWPKFTAGLAAAVAVTGAVVVVSIGGTSPQSPSQPPGAQITAAPVLADVSPPVATQPSDQSTPLNALKKLSDAVQSNDRAAIAECLCDDGVDPDAAAMARAFFLEEAGIWRLQNAWKDKFGAAISATGLNFDDFPGHGTFETLLSQMLDFPDGLETSINGDIAQVRVPLPREAFVAPPPNQISALGRWSGAMLVFKQANGNWKLDTDRTFNFLAYVAEQPGNNKSDLAIEAKIISEMADGLDAVASDIESGKITARQQASSGVEAAARRAFRDAHVDGASFVTLPVVGG